MKIQTKYMRLLSRALLVWTLYFGLAACKKEGKSAPNDTAVKGTATFLVEESLMPIAEDVISVFESSYDAHISLIARSESEIVNELLAGNASLAILTRALDSNEVAGLHQKKVHPIITPFASDAVALIRRKSVDSIVALDDVLKVIKSKASPVKGIVFDDLNSGAARMMLSLSGESEFPEEGIYSFGSTVELIEYVSQNDGMIGVIGSNWLYQPPADTEALMGDVTVLQVSDENGRVSSPSQNDVGEGKYPLARDLFVIDCQGYRGLGVGISAFIAGERGQRIILKSGLMPVRMPSRKILTRPNIIKEHKQ